MKKCNTCKQTKPLTEFHNAKGGKQGKTSQCKLCVKEVQQKNKEANKQTHYEWVANNKEKYQEYQKNYSKDYRQVPENKEKKREANRIYSKTPKGKAADARKRAVRRGKEKQLVNEWTYDIEQNMLKSQSSKCNICGTDITDGYHRDHIIPVSKQVIGGLGLHPDNVQLLCSTCNHIKSNKTP